VYIRRKVPPHIGRAVRELKLHGLHVDKEFKRFYPAGNVISQVVGFCGVDNVGLEGIEDAYGGWLTGQPGKKRVVIDLNGNVIDEVVQIEPMQPGKELFLSIDLRLQTAAMDALKTAVIDNNAHSGSVVAMDVETGEILAMANYPTYNPNNPDKPKDGRMKNLAVTDMVEPGSVIKPFTIAAGLESGKFKASTKINTSPGTYKVAGHTIRDVHNYKLLDVTGVITKSSNVGASKIALSIRKEELWDVFRRFGFGQVTGSGFTGEVSGLLPSYRTWHKVEQATLAYGYRLNVTPLQLVRAYAAIADGGRIRTPTFIKNGISSVESVLDPEISRQIKQMLGTVTQPGGTGTRAKVRNYKVAGKTGTTKKVGASGYESKYVASFAGFAPLTNPRIVIAVVIDNPQGDDYYGGKVAAPVFREVMESGLRLFDIPPDDLSYSQMADAGSLR
ncbi:MAG: peptidoglycan D,D-transpeptidase FtsI family protein, partial [bacterium]